MQYISRCKKKQFRRLNKLYIIPREFLIFGDSLSYHLASKFTCLYSFAIYYLVLNDTQRHLQSIHQANNIFVFPREYLFFSGLKVPYYLIRTSNFTSAKFQSNRFSSYGVKAEQTNKQTNKLTFRFIILVRMNYELYVLICINDSLCITFMLFFSILCMYTSN